MDDAEDLSRQIVSKADENQINPVGSDANAPRMKGKYSKERNVTMMGIATVLTWGKFLELVLSRLLL